MSNTIEFVKQCIKDTEEGKSKLDKRVLGIKGMSDGRNRKFLNNVCSREDCRYLEIGVHRGSTFCSAICKNTLKAFAIDNWAEFGNNSNEFVKNVNTYKGKNDIQFIETDCFKYDISKFPYKFNTYFYDGGHTYDDQYKAITYYCDAMDDEFILMVDDWNQKKGFVKRGTRDAIKELNLNVIFDVEKPWWNGFYVAVIKK